MDLPGFFKFFSRKRPWVSRRLHCRHPCRIGRGDADDLLVFFIFKHSHDVEKLLSREVGFYGSCQFLRRVLVVGSVHKNQRIFMNTGKTASPDGLLHSSSEGIAGNCKAKAS